MNCFQQSPRFYVAKLALKSVTLSDSIIRTALTRPHEQIFIEGR